MINRNFKKPPVITQTAYTLLLLLYLSATVQSAEKQSNSADLSDRIKAKDAKTKLLIKQKLQWQKNILLFETNRKEDNDLAKKKQDLEKLLGEIEDLKKNNESLKERIDKLHQKYRSHIYQIRSNAMGEKMPSLKLSPNKKYKDVTIKEINPHGMRITHSSGAATLPYEKLPLEYQNRFNFNPNQADAHRKHDAAQQKHLRDRLDKPNPQQPIPNQPLKRYGLQNSPVQQEAPKQIKGKISVRVIASKRNGKWVSKKIEIAAKGGTEEMQISVSSPRGNRARRTVQARQTMVFTVWVSSKYTVRAYQNGQLVDEATDLRKRGLGL